MKDNFDEEYYKEMLNMHFIQFEIELMIKKYWLILRIKHVI